MLKRLFTLSLFILSLSPATAQLTYNPRYWVQGGGDAWDRTDEGNGTALASGCDNLYARGWRGILYWGADRDGAKMNYYYRSPFLEKQPWAAFKRDGLTSRVKAAHASGLKVMINIEGVNPWHWKKNQWTPENIKMVADDLAAQDERPHGDLTLEKCAIAGNERVLGNDLTIDLAVYADGSLEVEHTLELRALPEECRDLGLLRCS